MNEANFEKAVERISRTSGLNKEEILRRIDAKCSKLSGLISKDGAAQIIAAELGISFENEKFKIDELLPGMKRVNFSAKITQIFPVRSFERNGQQNKVLNMIVADETGNIKVVLWDTNHIELIEKGHLASGSVVDIANSSVRENEVHLGSFSEIKSSNQVIANVKTEKLSKSKNVLDFKVGDSVKTRAFVVHSFEPRFFMVCPSCKKKVVAEAEGHTCAEHGKVNPEKRAFLTIFIDDGTETIRTVIFHDSLIKAGVSSFDDAALLEKERRSLLGKEMFFSGSVRMNNFFNNAELVVNAIEEVSLDELIQELQN